MAPNSEHHVPLCFHQIMSIASLVSVSRAAVSNTATVAARAGQVKGDVHFAFTVFPGSKAHCVCH